MKIIKRIIVLPFVFGLLLVSALFYAFKRGFLFIKHGGEFILYEKDEQTTIDSIYNELKKK